MIGQVLVNSIISNFVGIGQGRSRNLTTESDMIKLLVMGIQACFNIPQTFPIRKLGKGKTEKLVITGKLSNPVITLVFINEPVKLIRNKERAILVLLRTYLQGYVP